MPSFGQKSKERLATCCQELQDLFNSVIQETDCTIICGHRGQKEQDEAFENGFSKVKWPNGNHNKLPSRAVDVCPMPINWDDIEAFKKFAEVVEEHAKKLGIKVTWGGHWTTLKDYPHWEV